jgi:hypothetical protein
MSLTSTTDKSGPFLISSLPATIATGFPFQQGADLLVLDTGPASAPYDPAHVLVLGSDYSVTGGGYNTANQMQTGSIVVVSTGSSAVAVNDNLVIMRGVSVNQLTSLLSTGPLTAQLIEQALDKQATLSQQLTENVGRALQFENWEFQNPVLTYSTRLNNLLGFGPTGEATFYPPTVATGNTNVASSSLVVANGSTTPRTLANWVSDIVNVMAWGPDATGTNDSTAAVNSAYAQAKANGGGWVYFPPGTYKFNLTMTGSDNVSIVGQEGGTTFKPTSHSAVITISGYSSVLSHNYFKGFKIYGTGNAADQGINATGTNLWIENVDIANVGICYVENAALGHHILNCKWIGTNCGALLLGTSSEYSGFNVWDDVEIGGSICGIVKYNSTAAGGGGDDFRKVYFVGAGIYFYGLNASIYATPDFFHYTWTEGLTATTVNLSTIAAGLPSSLTVNGNGFFFVNSNATMDAVTCPVNAATNSAIFIGQYETENGQYCTMDATSLVTVDRVTTGTSGLWFPYVANKLIPYQGYGITCLDGNVRDALDFSSTNIMGGTGDGTAAISTAGTGFTTSIVQDDTAPVFNQVVSFTLSNGKNGFLYTYTTSGQGDTYLNVVAGNWYVYTYSMILTAGNGLIGPNWTNLFPPLNNPPLNTWLRVKGIFYAAANSSGRDMTFSNSGTVASNGEWSQFQLVQFTDGAQAQAFLNSNRYAACYPGVSPTPRYALIDSKNRTLRSAGAPSSNSTFVGQRCLNTNSNGTWYTSISVGNGASDWKQY